MQTGTRVDIVVCTYENVFRRFKSPRLLHIYCNKFEIDLPLLNPCKFVLKMSLICKPLKTCTIELSSAAEPVS